MPNDLSWAPLPKSGLPVFGLQEHEFTLIERRQETADTVTFVFNVVGETLRHLPGQAVVLELPMPDGPEFRTFTVCSSGRARGRAEVTVKAAESGFATRWMHHCLEINDTIKARGPFGEFTLANTPKRPLVLIGGGSGFTPIMSMLRWLRERRENADVTVIQAASSVGDLLFRDELAEIAAEMPNLQLFLVPSKLKPGEAWNGLRGRLSRVTLRAMLGTGRGKVGFCCGPEPFMDSVKRLLLAQGVHPEDFHTETFGEPKRVKAASTDVDEPSAIGTDGKVEIEFRGKKIAAQCGSTVFDALAQAGERIPKGCGVGACGTCRLKLTAGAVDMVDSGGLSRRERDSGYILACCSKVKEPLSLEDMTTAPEVRSREKV